MRTLALWAALTTAAYATAGILAVLFMAANDLAIHWRFYRSYQHSHPNNPYNRLTVWHATNPRP